MTPEAKSGAAPGTPPPLLNGRYELGDRLSEGLFFFTHRGRDTETGRSIAIKVLKPEFATDEPFVSRLLTEARGAISLSHASIAKVYDAWRERGTLVIVSEWVRGISLADRLRRVAPFPMAVAMDITQALASGLHYAHESGFVHGDLRPENVVITPDGRVKITDFGVGTSLAGSARIQLAALQSAAYYLAPEIANGHAPDARTDLYSLGCIVYEMLTGDVPYPGETPIAVAARHLRDPVPSSQDANPQVPNAVDGLVRKCLQKDPMRRYQAARPVLDDTRRIQDGLRDDEPLDWSPMAALEENPTVSTARRPGTPRRARPVAEPDGGPSVKLLVGLAVAAIVLFAVSFFGIGLATGVPRQVAVPRGIVGMERAAAVAELERVGLKAEIKEEYHPDVARGFVYETIPAVGTELRAGKSVALYISRGPQPVLVPDLVGKKQEEALRELRASGFVPGETQEVFSYGFEKGHVMSQTPLANSQASKGSAINLIVSKGEEPELSPQGDQFPPGSPEDTDTRATVEPVEPPGPGGVGDDQAGEPQRHEHVVTVSIPRRAEGPQWVEIIVENEDGSRQTAHNQEHPPGATIEETVTTYGRKGRCKIRVWVNGKLFQTIPV